LGAYLARRGETCGADEGEMVVGAACDGVDGVYIDPIFKMREVPDGVARIEGEAGVGEVPVDELVGAGIA
jgi:hypothetical protein